MRILVSTLLLAAAFTTHAQAAAISNHMTCQQAVAYYEKYKKIYTITRTGDMVPIYGLKPPSQRSKMTCRGRHKSPFPWGYFLQTLDKKNCIIGYRCQ